MSDPPRLSQSEERAATIWTVVVFAALSLICAKLSAGFVAADACSHYLYARFAFVDPSNLVDVWARPFCTALYALPAHFGARFAVRVVSLLVALGCSFVAAAIGRGQGLRRPALALLLTLGQPLLFVYSFGEMTELPFALLLGGAFWAWQGRRWFLAALLTGLLPTARPEGFGFILLVAAGFLLDRRWLPLLLLPLPLLAWDLGGWALTGRTSPWWRWLLDAWPWAPQGLYGRGSILTFVAQLPMIVSPLVLPATLLGTWRSLRDGIKGRADESADRHLRICIVLTAAIPLCVLLVHSVLRATGKFGSFGEPRYLLIAAPFWGVLSARGWEWAFARLNWAHPMRWAAAAVLVPVAINAIRPAVPIPLGPDWQTSRRVAEWYQQSPLRRQYPHLIASHPGVSYFLDQDLNGVARELGFTRGTISRAPAGTLLVWDPLYSARNANAEETATVLAIEQAGWIRDPSGEDAINAGGSDEIWHVFRSPEPARR